jgi:hypothetical protein
VKLVHLFGFITKKFVTMHGHMNVEEFSGCSCTHVHFEQFRDCMQSRKDSMSCPFVHNSSYVSCRKVFPPLMISLCMSIQNCKETTNESPFHLHISIVHFLQSSLARCQTLTIGSPNSKDQSTQLQVVPVLISAL